VVEARICPPAKRDGVAVTSQPAAPLGVALLKVTLEALLLL
jgi:hypothetical protein